MQAVVVDQLGEAEVLTCREVPVPAPGPDDVLIQVAAASVNFADIMARQGRYHGGSKPPFIPGLDCAGTIAAVGERVDGLQVGQRVAAFVPAGGYAQYAVAPAVTTYSLPDGVDWEQGAAFPTIGITAWNILTWVGRLQPGETVLVHAGAGGVGSTAIQLAKHLGAGKVIATVGADAKAELVRSLGADLVVNYRREPFAAGVLQATGNQGADLILDSLGGQTVNEGLTCLATFGRLVSYGHASAESGTVLTQPLHSGCKAVLGYSSGTYRRHRPALLLPSAQAVLDLLARGTLKLVIGKRFALQDAPAAHRWIESRQSVGKALLLP